MAVEIREAAEGDYEVAKSLVQEYVESLGIDLGFQEIEQELETFPGEYASPGGRLFLAIVDDETVGCVGVRSLEDGVCEMKRLYVKPSARGSGAGRALAERAVEAGHELGYTHMRLDTLPAMRTAERLYRSLDFEEIDPYRFNPVPGTRFFERELS